MDAATAEFYSLKASEVAARYESVASPVARFFGTAFAKGSRILDVGAGSGRDLGELLAAGYNAYGAEPSEALAALAMVHHPELAGRIARGALPQIGRPFGGGFDGILCSAVLMHVPEADLFDTVFALRQLLRPHGRLMVSLPLSRGDVDENERGIDGRLFKNYAPEYLQLLLERVGFQQIGRWDGEDALARAGTRWCTLLFELRSTGSLRAVDQIEGILNRDKKVASYKLALFRALAELATQEPRCAAWRQDGRIGVPVRRLAEKWLLYFWPIFAPAFIAGWDRRALKASVGFGIAGATTLATDAIERRYALRILKRRLHQASFRDAVISAYRGRCALSGLPEPMLLDAAHIVSDGEGTLGQPVVPNGIPLSKIHHAAFDAHLIGIDPDYKVHVAERLRMQDDGPLLEALKCLHLSSLHLPGRDRDRPDRDKLAERFEMFKSAA